MNRPLLACLIALVLLVVLPHLGMGDYYINLFSQILIFALFAASVNLIVGYGGMISLGHAAYLGIAAYSCTWLVTHGYGQLTAALGALLLTTVVAAGFGMLALRATGLSFLMITLALGQIVWGLAYRWVGLTNGDNGMALPARPAPFGISLNGATSFYYFALLVFACAIFCIWRMVHSPFGAALKGARDQPRRMSMLGHDVWMIRWLAFILSGFWAGVAGLLFIYYQKFVSPYALSLQQSAEVLLMTILGGAGTLSGPVVGAVIVTLVKNVASSYVERWNALLGLIFVVAVMFMPHGIVPGLVQWRRAVTRRKAKAVEAARSPAEPPRADAPISAPDAKLERSA